MPPFQRLLLAPAVAAVLCGLGPAAAAADPAPAFTDYPALAANSELIRRAMSPLEGLKLREALVRGAAPLAEAALDPRRETFAVHVPPVRPAAGYGMLVFVPPWEEAAVPPGWTAALDRLGVIVVTAGRSGNAARIFSRRMPLALVGAANVIARYAVDRRRVYVGGFSGGSRVALRLALAYPDLFRGVVLNAGADPIGAADAPLPPRDLFALFQQSTRVAFVTGDRDEINAARDRGSEQSMAGLCVFQTRAYVMPGRGHEPADPGALVRAMAFLDGDGPADPAKLADCRSRLDGRIAADLAAAEALGRAGRDNALRARLQALDRRYGGLAAPRITALYEGAASGDR